MISYVLLVLDKSEGVASLIKLMSKAMIWLFLWNIAMSLFNFAFMKSIRSWVSLIVSLSFNISLINALNCSHSMNWFIDSNEIDLYHASANDYYSSLSSFYWESKRLDLILNDLTLRFWIVFMIFLISECFSFALNDFLIVMCIKNYVLMKSSVDCALLKSNID